jgi:hypothetical protein
MNNGLLKGVEPNKKEIATMKSAAYQVWRAEFMIVDALFSLFFLLVAVFLITIGASMIFKPVMGIIVQLLGFVYLFIMWYKNLKFRDKYTSLRYKIWNIRKEVW